MSRSIHMLKLSSLGPGKATGKGPAAKDPAVEKQYPAIHLLMTATVDDAGKARKTCTLTLCCEGGLWKGGLRDKDEGASCWRSGKTLDGLLRALEDALVSGEADWRVSTPPSRK
jgi:hypothetical protein